jgi:hypothetical protein
VKIDVLKGYPKMNGKNFEDSYISAVQVPPRYASR